MSDAELNDLYESIKAKIERGEQVTVLEEFLYTAEHRRRTAQPNPLQRGSAARAKNPLPTGRINP